MKSAKSASVNYAANKMVLSINPTPIERVDPKACKAWWKV